MADDTKPPRTADKDDDREKDEDARWKDMDVKNGNDSDEKPSEKDEGRQETAREAWRENTPPDGGRGPSPEEQKPPRAEVHTPPDDDEEEDRLSVYDLNVYSSEKRLSNEEFMRRLLNDELKLMREVRGWERKYDVKAISDSDINELLKGNVDVLDLRAEDMDGDQLDE